MLCVTLTNFFFMSFLAQNSRTLVALSRAVGTASANKAAAAADTPSPSTALRPVSNSIISLALYKTLFKNSKWK